MQGAVVRFKGRRKRTNAKGVARIRVRIDRPRRARAATRIGCTKRKDTVRVRLRR